MSSFLEVIMLICFGASWPINFRKSWMAKTAKSTSLAFLCMIELGYTCGILAKIISHNINYVLAFYILDIALVGSNIILYFINRRKDKLREIQDENPINI